jgi:hypothetical protein
MELVISIEKRKDDELGRDFSGGTEYSYEKHKIRPYGQDSSRVLPNIKQDF